MLTRSGTVMAAPGWDRPGQIYRLAPASRSSVEALLGRAGLTRSLLLPGPLRAGGALGEERPQRAIGVVFTPEREPGYQAARLATQFDAVAYFDESRAVEPLR